MLTKLKENKIPLIIFFISVAVRILLNILVRGFYFSPVSDAAGYEELGWHILNGEGMIFDHLGGTPSATDQPLLPLVISFIYMIFGRVEFLVRVFISFFDSFIAVLMYYFGRRLYMEKAGILAALVYAFSPFAIGECLQISTEVLFTLLILLFTYYFHLWQSNMSYKRLFLLGLFLALASLTRPTSLYLFIFVACYLGFLYQKDKDVLKKIAVFILSFVLIMSPWVIRNYRLFNRFVVNTNVGGVMLGAHNPEVINSPRLSGTWHYGEYTKPAPADLREDIRSDLMIKQAKDNIKKYWYKMPLHEFNKLKYFWNFIPNLAEEFNWPKAILGFMFFGVFLPFFFFGVYKDHKRADMGIVWLIILYFNLITLMTYGSIRMRFPINPYIYIISVSYLVLFADNIYKKLKK
jgi:4-amino-4-deoxy-L-arabinose transferase-like glycosyltransferase